FKYSGLKLTPDTDPKNPGVTVEFEIANTGGLEGAETAQIYVEQENPRVERPPKELKQFVKVSLKPGAKQKVSVHLGQGAFAYYDPEKTGWVAQKGEFKILVGKSSREIVLHGKYKLSETVIQPD